MRKKLLITIPLLLILFGGIFAISLAVLSNAKKYELRSEDFETTIAFNDEVDLNGIKIYDKDAKREISVGEFAIVRCDDTSSIGNKVLVVKYKDKEFTINFTVKYKVEFLLDGQVIETQYVNSASEIVVPDTVEKTGYEFISWDKNIPLNLTDNIQFEAIMCSTTLIVPKLNSINVDYGTTLAEISLPSNQNGRWVFVDELQTLVGDANQSYKFDVKFIPNTSELIEKFDQVEINVKQKQLQFNIAQDEFVYDGKPHFPIYNLPVQGLTVDVMGSAEILANNEGEKYDYYLVIVSNNYVGYHSGTFTIKKADVTIKVDDKTVYYGENFEMTYQVQGFEDVDILGINLDKYLDKNAGVYEIGATISNPNVNLKKVEKGQLTVNKINIDPSPVNPTLSTSEKPAVYGDKLSSITIVNDFPNGVWVWENPDLIIDKIQGFTAYAIFTHKSANYNTIRREIEIDNIDKKTLEITINKKEFTYDGNEHTIQYQIENGEHLNLTVTGNYPQINAGKYQLNLAIDSEFYKGSRIVEMTILKAIPETDFSTKYETVWYSGITLENATKLDSDINSSNKIELPRGYYWKNKETSLNNIGTFTYPVIFTPNDTQNYKSVEGAFEVTINKALSAIKQVEELYNPTYTGNAYLIKNIQPSHYESQLQYVYTYNGYNVANMINAGEYQVKIILPESEHYIGSEATTVVIIKKASVEVALDCLTAIYEDTLEDINLPDDEDGVWTWKEDLQTSVGVVGIQSHIAVYTPNDSNYAQKEIMAMMQVEPKQLNFVIINNTYTYDGNEKLVEYNLIDANLKSYSQLNVEGNEKQINAKVYNLTLKVSDTNYTAIKDTQLIINKATPTQDIPTGLTATYLDEVKSVVLPGNDIGYWQWVVDEYTLVGNAGINVFDAVFVFNEQVGLDNYEDFNAKITVNVNKKSVDIPTLDTNSAVYTGSTIKANINETDLYFVTNGWTNVGDYDVVLTLKDNLNYIWANNKELSTTIPFTITKAQAIISNFGLNGWTYNTQPNQPIANTNFGIVKYSYSTSEDGEFVDTQPTNAGTYYVKAFVEDNDNYYGTFEVISFEIEKAEISKIDIDSKVYTGRTLTADIYSTDIYNVSVNNGGCEVGTYSVVLTIINNNYIWFDGSETNIELMFNIVKAQAKINDLQLNSWTFNHEANTPTANANFGTITYTYLNPTTGKYELDQPINAGNYIVKATVEGTDNYYGTYETAEFIIYKDKVEIPEIESKIYTGSNLIADIEGNDIYEVSLNDGGTNVGKYPVKLTIIDNNYMWSNGVEDTITVTFEITKAQAVLIDFEIDDWVFGEEGNKIEVTSTFGEVQCSWLTQEEIDEYLESQNVGSLQLQHDNIVTSSTYPTYRYHNNTTVFGGLIMPTEAGTYYIKMEVVGNDNFAGIVQIVSFVIEKAPIQQIVLPEKTYTGLNLIADISSGSIYQVVENLGGINIGEYEVTLSITNKNYKWWNGSETTITLTFKIVKAQAVISNFTMNDWTYGQMSSDPSASTNFGTIEYTYSTTLDGEYVSTKPTNAGTYYVKAEVKDNDNYYGVSKIISFTINKAEVQIPTITSKVYTGNNLVADIEQSSLYTIVKNEGGIEKGVYDVVLELTDVENYKWIGNDNQRITLKFEITLALNEWITIPTIIGWTFGQEHSTPKAKSTFGEVIIKFKSQNQDDTYYSSDMPTNAGNYIAKFAVEGTNDYNGLTALVTFTISKTSVEIPSVNSKVYTGETLIADIIETEQYIVTENLGGINVGKYPVILTIVDNNYKWENGSETTLEIEFEITQAQAEIIDFELDDFVFGETVNISNATTSFGEIEYTYSTSIDGEYTSTKPTNAGTYYVKAEVKETTNYAGASKVVEFTIEKAELEIPSVASKVYTGGTLTADIRSTSIYSVTANHGGVDVGSYEVELTIIDTNYKWSTGSETTAETSFEITKAQAVISEFKLENWTYGTEANTPSASTNFGEIEYTYSTSESGEFGETQPTNAGTYYVKAEVEGTDNYTGTNLVIPFTINQAQAIISNFTLENWTYGESSNTPSATTNFGIIEYSYADVNKEIYTTTQPTNAGTYYVKAKVDGTDNYIGAIQIISFEITQASNQITSLKLTGWEYGAEGNNPSASATFGSPEYTYSTSIDGEYTSTKPTNAGTYYVKAEVKETTNYAGASKVVEFTIEKAEIAVPNVTSKVYTGKTLTADIKDTTIYKVTSNLGGIEVGSYEVELTIINTNYKWNTGGETTAVTTFEITKAQAIISEFKLENWTYGTEANTPSASTNFGEIEYTYSTSESGEFGETQPTNAGTYYVKAEVKETNNYIGASQLLTFVINKASIDLPSVISKIYTGETLTADIASTEIYSVTKNLGGINAGEYPVELTITNTNYKWNSANETITEIIFTITQASNQITSLKLTGWEYGAEGNNPSASATFGSPEYTYSTSIDGEYTSTKPTNAGTYYVKGEVKETSNYAGASKVISFNITKAQAEITNFAISGWIYGQTANTPTITASSFVKASEIAYYYKSSDSAWSTTVPTNAGSYVAKAVILDTNNFNGCESAEVGFSISKATPTLTAPTYGTVYMNVDNLATCYTSAPLAKNLANNNIPGTWNYGAITFANGTNASSFTLTFNPTDTTNYVSNNTITVNITVKSVARISGVYYPTIESALDVAVDGNTIFVDPDVTGKVMIKQNCEIKSGVTLVLLYGPNDTDRCSDGKAQLHSGISKAYNGIANLALKNLVIVDNNKTITNNGTIEVAGELSGSQGGSAYAGHTARNYAELRLNNGAIINSTGEIKVTGFINESSLNNGSQINVESGTLYMPFVMRDFRGGSYMYAAYNAKYKVSFFNRPSCEISPFNQYQLRNISSKFVIKNTANMQVYANMYASEEVQFTTIKFVGSASSYMFQFIDNTYSYLVAKYNPTTGVIKTDMYGGINMNTLTLSLAGTSINTSNTYFPLPWTINISLNKAEGQTSASYTINQKIKVLPGCEIIVGKGASVTAGNVSAYASYTDTTEVSAETKYPSKPGAKLIVEGSFSCSNFGGNIYSTTEGATVTISSASSMTTYETTGAVSGKSILASISTTTITNATNFYYGTTCQISSASTGTYKFTNGVWTKS